MADKIKKIDIEAYIQELKEFIIRLEEYSTTIATDILPDPPDHDKVKIKI